MVKVMEYKQYVERLLADDEFALAVEACKEASRLYPEYPEFRCLHAAALERLGDVTGALDVLQFAASEFPREHSIFSALGGLYVAAFRDFDHAECQFLRAISLNPNESAAYLGYAHCRIQQGEFDELWPQQPAHAHLELLIQAFFVQLRNYGRYSEARGAVLRWLHEFRRGPDALLALAQIEDEAEHDLEEARRHIRTALHLFPGATQCHVAHIATLVKIGDWTTASREAQKMMRYFGLSFPQFVGNGRNWDGSSLARKTVLLDNTLAFGYGDLIQFSRFATALHDRGAKVGIRTRKRLKSVLRTVPGVDFVISLSEPVFPVDYMTDMSLLWLLLKVRMDNLGVGVPYLEPSGITGEPWTLATKDLLRVGIVPRSGERYPFNRYTARNPSIEEFAVLHSVPNVQFYAFEIPPSSPTLGNVLPCAVLTKDISDFGQTAGLLSQMDIVITVETAMAHLAGALGRPGFLLLPYSAEWRWMLNRPDTPWYPSLRLIRQPRPGDWRAVMQECACLLSQFAKIHNCASKTFSPSS